MTDVLEFSSHRRMRACSFLAKMSGVERRDTQTVTDCYPEFLALKHESRIFGHSSNPVCGFSMMEQVRPCCLDHGELIGQSSRERDSKLPPMGIFGRGFENAA